MSPMSPLFPGTLLTLMALMALLAAPGGGSAPAAARSNNSSSNESEKPLGADECFGDDDQPNLTIAATTADDRGFLPRGNHGFSWYGYDITIFCSSNDASSLTIQSDGHQPQAERLNSTTIQVTIIKPEVRTHLYRCTDSVTTCTEELLVHVSPGMAVTAPHLLQAAGPYNGDTTYFVPRGESYNLYCSSHQTPELTRLDRDLKPEFFAPVWDDIQAKSVNLTTVIATVSDHTEGQEKYACTQLSVSPLSVIAQIIVDYRPEARDFRCVLSRFRHVECWWKSMSKNFIFKLVVENEKGSTICLDYSSALTASCDTDVFLRLLKNRLLLRFQLETCIDVFCSNPQTFLFNVRSITRLDAPYEGLRVNTGAQDVTLEWPCRTDVNLYRTHKVEYRLLGRDWRAANASSELCEAWYQSRYKVQVALPCPDTHYELRVYVRYKGATLDMYWSEPATLFLYTAPSTGGEVDPACGADFREPEPPLSAAAVLHKLRELISDERQEKRALKKYTGGLKKKLAQIKSLMDA